MENPVDSQRAIVHSFWQTIRAQIRRTPHWAPLLVRRSRHLLERFHQTYQTLCRLPRPLRRRWQRQLGATLGGVALALTLGNALLYGADITVNTNVPAINDDSQCSLIEAIINANNDAATYANCAAGSGADTIILPVASTHTLTESYYSDYYTGLPPITSTITIAGNGATIVRDSAEPFIILAVIEPGDLTLNETTITGGYADGNGGGAIYNAAGAVALNNSTIFSNTAVFGGGIFNLGGTLALTDSAVSGNTAMVYGAGIFNAAGVVTLTNSAVSGNMATYSGGGGIASLGAPGVRSASQSTAQADWARLAERAILTGTAGVTLLNSTVTENTAGGSGGGILNFGTALSLTSSTVATNTATCCGGGIYSDYGTVTLTDSTVISNTSGSLGGGIASSDDTLTLTDSAVISNTTGYDGGGIDSYGSLVTLTNSTVRANRALSGDGGGMDILGGAVTLINSTLSDNWAAEDGGGMDPDESSVAIDQSTLAGNVAGLSGGAISLYYGSVALTNTTISGNFADLDGGGLYVKGVDTLMTVADSTIAGNIASNGVGGGLSVIGDATVALTRTLISGNTATSGGNEVYAQAGITLTSAFNLFGHSGQAAADAIAGFAPSGSDLDATSDGPIPTALANILETTLADNGGDTQTHALVVGSPAINAAGAAGPATDQRGLTRPQGTAFDIGAYEIESALINSQLTQVSFTRVSATTTPDSTYPTQSVSGVMVAALTLKNTGDAVSNVYYTVTTLNNGNWLLNADGAPGQVGSILSVANATLPGSNQLWDQTENLTQNFTIGMMVSSGLSFRVDVYGVPTVAAAGARGPQLLGSYGITLDPTVADRADFRLFLPTVRQ